jgi:SAM-dependent methyltransferase
VIVHEDIDATIAHHYEEFDIVVFKSVLGSTGDEGAQRKVVEGCRRALRPGGELWFAENLRASSMHRVARRIFIPWARSWVYLDIADVEGLLRDFGDTTLSAWGVLGAFGRNEYQRSALAGLDRAGAERLFPRRSRYVVAGVARKVQRSTAESSVRKSTWISPARVR